MIIAYIYFNIERSESLMMKESWYPVHLQASAMTILLHLCYSNKNFICIVKSFKLILSNQVETKCTFDHKFILTILLNAFYCEINVK